MSRTAILGIVSLVLAAGQMPAQTAAASAARLRALSDYSIAMEDLARSASPAVVQVLVRGLAPLKKGDTERMGFVSEEEATGSGIIVDPTGYIVTNAHVVQNARRINVKMLHRDTPAEEPHPHSVPAKLVGLDTQVDIAVIKIEATNLPTLSFRDSDTLRQGQMVLAVGSPLGLENSLTHGVVSATRRQLDSESPMVYIQTDAPINPGNSGGPLLDVDGHVAGINTMIFSQSGGNEGIGFAIPANLAKDTYLRLRKDGHVHRGIIGVIPDTITQTMAAGLGLSRDSGVILSDVEPQGPAETAGLLPGDIVLKIDGKPMYEARDLGLAVFQRAPGDELHMDILRGTQTLSMVVPIIDRPHEPSQLGDFANDAGLIRRLGILAVTVDDKVRAILPDLRRRSGVAVAAVPAEYAGLNPGLVSGDVIYALNTKPITSLDDLRAALQDTKTGAPIVFFVERQGQLIYVTATLE